MHRNNYELTDSHPSQQNICGTPLSIIKMCQTMTRRHSRLNRMYFKPLAIVPLKAGLIEDSFIFLKMQLQAAFLQQYTKIPRQFVLKCKEGFISQFFKISTMIFDNLLTI